MSKKVVTAVKKKFKAAVLDTHSRLGDETIILDRSALHEVCEFLKHQPKMEFNMLMDVTAVDYLNREPRFEVVYHLYSLTQKHRLRLRVPLEESDPVVPTLTDVWRAANWGEREVWDMYGIRFEGHPDLRRILLYAEFEGHPLRKDYPIQRSQPRMDLRRKERDSVEEYRTMHRDRAADSDRSAT